MAKQIGIEWVIIAIIALVVIGMFVQKSYEPFAATGSSVSRSVPSSVSPGETFQIQYVVSTTDDKWGVSIEDSVSGGCTFSNGESSIKFVITSAEGSPRIMEINAPSSEGSCTFTGDFKFDTDPIIDMENSVVTVATAGSTCSELGGSCCSSGQSCTGGTFQTSTDCGSLCCVGGTCETPSQTCSELGGVICNTGETCSTGSFTSASDTTRCCVGGTCETGVSFNFDLDTWFGWAAIYDINKDGIKDGVDGLMITIGGIIGLLIFSRIFGG